jgi:hypothetical protein
MPEFTKEFMRQGTVNPAKEEDLPDGGNCNTMFPSRDGTGIREPKHTGYFFLRVPRASPEHF